MTGVMQRDFGFWFAYFRRKNAVTLTVARGAEGTGFYVAMGFAF